MEELREHLSAVLHRGETSSSNHASCVRELNDLLGEHGELLVEAFYTDLAVFLFNKQLKTEPASRLRELMAKFIAAEDRDNMEPETKAFVPKLNQKCIGLLKAASHVADNEVRACALAMLAAIVKSSGSKFSDNVHKDLSDAFIMRLEDKISAVRNAASDGIRSIWEFLAQARADKIEAKLRPLARDDPRSEVRASVLKCLPLTSGSAAILVERTGDYECLVRTAAMERLVDLPLEFLSMDAVHTLADNAYKAALNYESTQASEHREEEPLPMTAESGTREIYFSPAARRRREEKALFAVLKMLLRGAEDDLWTLLTWFPLETNPLACIFILRTLFAHGIPFPENFSTRRPSDESDAQKSIILAVVHCERLSKRIGGKDEIDALVPEPVTIVDELLTSPLDSSKMIFLLKLTKFSDFSDEGGRVEMERALLQLLAKKPAISTVKLILQALVLVQDAVQVYVKQLVDIITGDWIDFTNKQMEWEPVLGFTLELLNSLPTELEEFPALLRIESDILLPAAKPVMHDTNGTNTNLQTLYTKCIAALGKFIGKTREEHFADLCFWVTNPKKSMPLRGAAITALIEWFSIPNILPQLKGALDPTSLATTLLKLASDSPVSSPLTFSSILGISRLLFSGLVTNAEVIGRFMSISFINMISDPRLRNFLSSFFPTWASYPDSGQTICPGFLQCVRQMPEDVPNVTRKALYKYCLKLIFGGLTTPSDFGRYNDSIGRKILKIIYEGSRDDCIDILKDLDFYGISGKEKEVLDRMTAKVANKLPHLKDSMRRICHTMENASEPKSRASTRFPDPPAKKEKPGTPLPGRSSLDSEAHAKLKESMEDAVRQRKRSRQEMEFSKEGIERVKFEEPAPRQAPTLHVLDRFAQQFAKIDEYQLKTSTAEDSPRKERSRDSRSSKTPSKPVGVKRAVPVTEPKPKRPKMSEIAALDDGDVDTTLTETNDLIRQLQSRLQNPEAVAALQSIAKHVGAEGGGEGTSHTTSRRLVSKRQLGTPMQVDEPEDSQVTETKGRPKPLRKLEELLMLESVSSRSKRARGSAMEASSTPQAPSKSRVSRADSSSSIGSSLAPLKINNDSDVFDEDTMIPDVKKPKKQETTALSSPSQQRASRSRLQLSQNDNSTQSKKARAQATTNDTRTDWKKKRFPVFSASKPDTITVGLLGYASHEAEAKKLMDQLQALGVETREVSQFEAGSLTHLVVRTDAERSRTSCCYGISGCWIMSSKWVAECVQQGSIVPETGFGFQLTKSLFNGQTLVFSPGVNQDATMKRFAAAMVKEGGGKTTMNSSKANTMICCDDDDVDELIQEFDDIPLLSLKTIIEDLHQHV